MLCCAGCFGDPGLAHEILPRHEISHGTCPTCGSQGEVLVEASSLNEYFGLLMAAYEIDDQEGQPIVELLQEDWALFRSSDMDNAKSQVLLGEILDDGDVVRKPHRAVAGNESRSLVSWNRFKDELKYNNRFFPNVEFDEDRLEDLLTRLIVVSSSLASSWFRARICDTTEPFPLNEMGPPPKRKAGHGRANPAGIPYLYLASDDHTAVAEVRPHPGELVCIARYSTPDLKIVDLRHPRVTVSPFLSLDEEEIKLLRGDVRFLEELGEELTSPVLPTAAAIDYIPSQFLCEFVKKAGYDGLAYRSSVGEGVNLALFQPDAGQAIEVHQVKVTKLSIATEATH